MDMARGDPQIKLRIPEALKNRVQYYADKNNRSMNAEILSALEKQLPQPITIQETVNDLLHTIDILKKFKGKPLLESLADNLDELILTLSEDKDIGEDTKELIDEYMSDHAKFIRRDFYFDKDC